MTRAVHTHIRGNYNFFSFHFFYSCSLFCSPNIINCGNTVKFLTTPFVATLGIFNALNSRTTLDHTGKKYVFQHCDINGKSLYYHWYIIGNIPFASNVGKWLYTPTLVYSGITNIGYYVSNIGILLITNIRSYVSNIGILLITNIRSYVSNIGILLITNIGSYDSNIGILLITNIGSYVSNIGSYDSNIGILLITNIGSYVSNTGTLLTTNIGSHATNFITLRVYVIYMMFLTLAVVHYIPLSRKAFNINLNKFFQSQKNPGMQIY